MTPSPMPIAPRAKPYLETIAPYVGGTGGGHGVINVLKLSSNESPFGPSLAALEAFRAAAATLPAYPDGGARALKAALAARHGLDPDWIITGNGSDEILNLLAAAYAGPGDEVIVSTRTFAIYAIAARAQGARVVVAPDRDLTADVDALLAAVTPATRILFLANPNNPTGTYLDGAALRRLHAGLPPHVLLVIDAAYAEYATQRDYEAGLELVSLHNNVVMTRTFSKIYALAALRVGWAYARPEVGRLLDRIRMPFNVNGPAQAAAIAALGDTAHLAMSVAHNDAMRPWLAERLTALGFKVAPSAANFVLAEVPGGAAAAAALDAHLLGQGIHIRRFRDEGLEAMLRISIGRREALEAFLSATESFLRGRPAPNRGRPA